MSHFAPVIYNPLPPRTNIYPILFATKLSQSLSNFNALRNYIYVNTQHIYTHTHTYVHTNTHIYIHIHLYIHTHTHTYTHIHTHPFTHSHAYIYAHTHVHTRVHTRTHCCSGGGYHRHNGRMQS